MIERERERERNHISFFVGRTWNEWERGVKEVIEN